MSRKIKTMDGNTAAAHVSYAFTEVAAIYPITPSSVMAELTDVWSANGIKNIFGQPVRVMEMQSEAGAAGAVHGSLTAGAFTTTYTASQGLLLMIPNMYKIAGGLLPGVIHVAARAIATHALSIFGDHSDIMAARSTGYAILGSSNPQEVMDLGAVAHLATVKGSVPFIHFFDGFRTSHEMQKVEAWDYDTLAGMIDMDAVKAYRARALNPQHPVLRGSAQNPDVFFQFREASNPYYDKIPEIVEGCMKQVNDEIGTDYKLFNYYGAPDAEHVMIAMGSLCDTAEETIDYLMSKGEKVGLVKVRLYRPFAVDRFIAALPKTTKTITVMDRCKDPAGIGEPLYLDILSAVAGTPFAGCRILGGRYGLGSKDTTPGAVVAAFRNSQSASPINSFSVNIEDDLTHRSLPITEEPDTSPKGTVSCKFWGLGSDGTVGANKNSIKIIGDHTDKKVQAYFQYDSKKSGGVTISHIRFGDKPIKSSYYVSQANFIACHNASYMEKYDIVQDLKPGGVFLLNCPWDVKELGEHLPAAAKRYLAGNNIRFYTVDGVRLAKELGLAGKVNVILQAAFFKLADIIPIDDAVRYMKDAIKTSYGRKGAQVVAMNEKAVDAGLDNIVKVDIPAEWKNAADTAAKPVVDTDRADLKEFVETVLLPVSAQRGDKLPVSVFAGRADGTLPQGAAAFEKRGIAVDVPEWIPENCIQCNQCAYVCPHAVIRPFAMTADELKAAPEGTKAVKMNGKGCENYTFSMLISPLDCTGCGSCVNVCPAKNKALVMKPLESQMPTQEQFNYAVKNVEPKELPFTADTVKGSQFKQPLFEFSGACAGCGETPYIKLVTQLFGDRMYVANATGCTSIYSGSAPSTPYTVNREGRGPAWENSLFEDNAEFGFGIHLGTVQRRKKAIETVEKIAEAAGTPAALAAAAKAWVAAKDDAEASKNAAKPLTAELEKAMAAPGASAEYKAAYEMRDLFVKPSFWAFGGDGWAYDIGYGGLDHVIASGENINILVLDTEVYSNTGGQASKSSQTGQVAQFAAAGKVTKKKDLAQIAMAYGYVYVAQVAMGANYQQALKAIAEAEAYDGPSLIICYAPCINHGIRVGMGHAMEEMKDAVESGYVHLFRYDPRLSADGKNPFQLDSKAPTMNYRDFIMREVRYSSLELSFPDRAKKLFAVAEENAKQKYAALAKRAQG
ncbi:pyruvate:ferredoxin (flavodoxin) oxidoreductase [Papillibacter cinnamivorans]|uniref:Pyruvate:ferredoxin oxidoreductase n=1 Tax=Papillibacter cinnamivorans DSM 12816 TaxID=1122930 RepID=A0A1W2CYQ4_9FIRM|nr:pyruvate:ferredoxin (flavodoxin) oxidoreductase [Papillibacter cinnamivorans]SMC90076.1 pyruvate-ferredoxin/flavodoxin oxidoreductase [Papillibacter cinnamivorans DSM 12816]